MHPKPPPPKHPITPGHGHAPSKDPLVLPTTPSAPPLEKGGKRSALTGRLGVSTRPPMRRSGRQGK